MPNTNNYNILSLATAKSDRISEQKEYVKRRTDGGFCPEKGDRVFFQTTDRDGNIGRSGYGKVSGKHQYSSKHYMYFIDCDDATIENVVVGHPSGFYPKDFIQLESMYNKDKELKPEVVPKEYFGLYDFRTQRVELGSLFTYRSDTFEYATSKYGNPLPHNLTIRAFIIHEKL